MPIRQRQKKGCRPLWTAAFRGVDDVSFLNALFEVVVIHLDGKHDKTTCARHQIGEKQRPDDVGLVKQTLQHESNAANTHH